MQNYTLQPIGTVHSPFKEKFGTPRQPGLVNAQCSIELLPPYNQMDALKGLEGFSHIWVSFIFHRAIRDPQSNPQFNPQPNKWQPTVRPPRLGGNEKIGVFASRSPFRPNNLGLSVAKLIDIEQRGKKLFIHVEGLDIIDSTPVVDIKPYIPYVDAIPDASEGFATGAPEKKLEVEFTQQAEQQLKKIENAENLRRLIIDVLELDPRPAYKQSEQKGDFGVRLEDYNIRWKVTGNSVCVMELLK